MDQIAKIGYVYLLHFSRPLGNPEKKYGTAQHYCGFTADVDGDPQDLTRVAEHLAGRGACITCAAVAGGIEISLVATWRAPRSFERLIKQRKEFPRFCPICSAARGRKVKRVVVPPEQLALPLFDQAEPWPDDFEFPDPPKVSRWAEIAYEQAARRANLPLMLAGAGDVCEDIPY